MARAAALLVLLLAFAAAGCGGGSDDDGAATTTTAAPAPVEQYVSSADLDAWPLTVPGGTLRCEGRGAVSFQTDEGIIYAVNPTGRTWNQRNNLGWSDVVSIQADDVTAGGKMKLGALIAKGVALCTAAQGAGTTTTG